ncbi:MAG: substrate-binding domain-containing protein, partial [Alphaproteobacteria bacterium]|nr:substrate-binding domain-containing protein [Alphaproteobacteria bacterium]
AHNDDMALGALQVLKENGREDVLIAGVDGLSEALDAMADGKFIATALNDPQYLGDVTIQVAREAAAGKTVPAFVDAGTALVTPDKVAEYPHTELFAEYRPQVLDK